MIDNDIGTEVETIEIEIDEADTETIDMPEVSGCEDCGFELWDDEECPYIMDDGSHI